jgi:hypothetical protein
MQLAIHHGYLLEVAIRVCPNSLHGDSLFTTFHLPHVCIPALVVFIEGFVVGDWDVEGRGEKYVMATCPK